MIAQEDKSQEHALAFCKVGIRSLELALSTADDLGELLTKSIMEGMGVLRGVQTLVSADPSDLYPTEVHLLSESRSATDKSVFTKVAYAIDGTTT